MSQRRILFLDAYDSFSNNVVSLLTTLLGVEVDILPIHTPRLNPGSPEFYHDFRRLLSGYDAVVCGPGPGSPDVDEDVGLMKHIWELEDKDLLPVLGICLGFQSLILSCGGAIRKLSGGLHGMIRAIDHVGQHPSRFEGSIFKGVPPFKATLYHSLYAEIGQQTIADDRWLDAKWDSPAGMPKIIPLAWVEEDRGASHDRILMAARHRNKPFSAVQYHPESICTEKEGHLVIQNWFTEAMKWNVQNGRVTQSNQEHVAKAARTPSLLTQSRLAADQPSYQQILDDLLTGSETTEYRFLFETLQLPLHVEVPDIAECLQAGSSDRIILDSSSANAARIGADVRGRYSIIGLDVAEALKFEYRVPNHSLVIKTTGSDAAQSKYVPLSEESSIWQLLAEYLERHRISHPPHDTPFIGGFMGYVTYEMGLKGIGVPGTGARTHARPDLCFAWITKSIVVDHAKELLYVQQLVPRQTVSSEWINTTVEKLRSTVFKSESSLGAPSWCSPLPQPTPPITPTERIVHNIINTPLSDVYENKVSICQDYIARGESYELCLTDQTTIRRPKTSSAWEASPKAGSYGSVDSTSWQLYRQLRQRQPAPFGSYIRLGGATLVSSSPERFLEYSAGGLCSMRPMKGTVRKSDAVRTLPEAEKILHVPKEEAENLMIVDLVRHDLHGVCGPGHVSVPQLMKVEEYASVFQMISVVEGQLPEPVSGQEGQRYTGLDALAASLPPGSMTGAPKKRSCEILQDIEEHKERSLYSGVVGYMDVAGRGDWSVTIRSMFRWDDELVQAEDGSDQEVWHIGAGGAVTALSTTEGEREEMFTKLKGPLGVFEV